MKSIVIKEIDVLTSKLHKGRVVTEYMIYLMENDVKLSCYTVIGDDAKKNKIIELEKIINMKTEYPLTLVFYLDREILTSSMIDSYVDSINFMIKEKNLNMVALFLPCGVNESERVECINPILVEKTDMEKINKLVNDIKTQFSVGVDENQCACNENCECKTNIND